MSRRTTIAGLILAGVFLAACASSGAAPSPAPQTPPSPLPPWAASQASPQAAASLGASGFPPSSLGLSGRLIFTEGPLGVTQWDLAANRISPIFVPPQNGVVNAASVSPDGKTIVMAYGPPPAPGKPQLGYTSLYTVPIDGSAEPAPLIPGEHSHEFFFTPRWSADGGFIYYGHYVESNPAATATPGFFLERRAYPEGEATTVTQDAFVPYLARDGSKMAYITVDQQSYLNNLYVAAPDGSNPASLLAPGTLWAIDSLTISHDGQYVVFSGDSSGPTTASMPDFYQWFGIRVAQAHSIPEDLWRVPVAGGPVERLTTVGVIGLTADYSPDGAHIAFIGSSGIYVLNSDGSGLTSLDGEPKFGSIQWAP